MNETTPALNFAVRCAKLGWSVIPIKTAGNGARKAPGLLGSGLQGWQRYCRERADLTQLLQWWEKSPSSGVGLPLGAVHSAFAIDLDIDASPLAAEVRSLLQHHLGETPAIRSRKNSPRCVLLYRDAHEEIRNRKVQLASGGLEIFGRNGKGVGGQVVVFGPHISGVPYEWEQESPATIAPDDLPCASLAQLEAAEADITAAVGGRSRPTGTADSGERDKDLFASLSTQRRTAAYYDSLDRRRRGKSRWLQCIESQLADARPGNLHDTLISVVAAMVEKGIPANTIRVFFDQHFGAPTTPDSPYSEVWSQLDGAIADAHLKWGPRW
jgi:hypothetical protein